jgi:hypothetical protein
MLEAQACHELACGGIVFASTAALTFARALAVAGTLVRPQIQLPTVCDHFLLFTGLIAAQLFRAATSFVLLCGPRFCGSAAMFLLVVSALLSAELSRPCGD